MKLDRNINPDGRGKYALVLMRELKAIEQEGDYSATSMVEALVKRGVVDHGGDDRDFFVIRIKDRFAAPALAAYAMAAYDFDQEYAMEVLNLAKKAAEFEMKRIPA